MLAEYYARRAQEYEKIYAKPERQTDLAALRVRIPGLLAERHVYEVACGTGYWTEFVAEQAASVFATDVNEEVLAIARTKSVRDGRVTWARADAFTLPEPPRPCDAGLAAFWWSHLRRGEQLEQFLSGFFARLEPGARFVFVDNRYVEGSSTPISRRDARGNTWQTRRLESGDELEVLKNFPDEAAVREALTPHVARIVWEVLPYYWCAWGELR
jgi:demethylmenaquinone methyltransferase/2-methoxy-6-polyprenyl-1,4-benzoquinol methylase